MDIYISYLLILNGYVMTFAKFKVTLNNLTNSAKLYNASLFRSRMLSVGASVKTNGPLIADIPMRSWALIDGGLEADV